MVHSRATSRDYAAFDRYVADAMPAWTEELLAFCRIPSEGGDAVALRAAADWTAERLRRVGAAVDVVEKDGAPPLVVAELGAGPTLLAVQHYDVQPAVPLELWTSPPYEPEVRGGRLYARGASDNKGELLARIWAVEGYLATFGDLPCRLRFLVQGEEEGGGGNFGPLLDLRPGLRDADGVLSEGGEIDAHGRPVVYGGVRGMVSFELVCRTIEYDAHSSLANLLPNAATRLVTALATFWDAEGVPQIAGLDDGIRPPTAADAAVLAGGPLEEIDDLFGVYGTDRLVAGRRGAEALEVLTFGTTCNLQGLWSGYSGPGDKTITPAEAHARIDVRLVPSQEPDVVVEAVRRHLAGHGFGDIELIPSDENYPAWWTPSDDPIIAAAIRASEAVLGTTAVQRLSAPGTEPLYDVCAPGNLPATSLGASDDDARMHAPDESWSLAGAALAAQITARFLDEFAGIKEDQ
jgi:acetylornithine deacetylase/succinyl-diaminopimelate desuccinylase-like protein